MLTVYNQIKIAHIECEECIMINEEVVLSKRSIVSP